MTLTQTTKRFEAEGHPSLVYDEYGDVASPPVVLLHGGAAGHRRYWLDIPVHLARTRRVLAMDMRGHGESDRANGDYRIEHYASDVEAFIEQIAGGAATLVGHSLGGLVAAQVAGTRPDLVDRALFEDAPLHWDGWESQPQASASRRFQPEEYRQKVRELLDARTAPTELLAALLEEWSATGEFFRPFQELLRALQAGGATIDDIVVFLREVKMPLVDLLEETRLQSAVGGFLAFDPEIFEAGKDWLAAYDPKRPMTCPVLMLRADASVPPPMGAAFLPEHEDAFLDTHPRAKVKLVPGVGHNIHIEKPDVFTEELIAFLGGEHA